VAGSPLVVPVAELLRRPGTRRSLQVTVDAEGLEARDARVPDGSPLEVDVVLESLADGVVVSGQIRSGWEGTCRRCLGPASGSLAADVHELYQHRPLDEEAFTFEGDQLDLRPMVRELAIVELPTAPLCRDECRGLCPICGVDRNTLDCGHDEAPADPRWSVLDALRERLPESG
jgi:uncharacterized protein